MRKIGLAFAGGGGRGAYQIGVWKALQEAGLQDSVAAISGTSVGGLNAALFLQGDIDKAVDTWCKISNEIILARKGKFKEQEKKYADMRDTRGLHFFERDGLIKIIDEVLDMSVFDRSTKNVYITCVRTKKIEEKDYYVSEIDTFNSDIKTLSHGKAEYFNMREFSAADRLKILLATSAIPFVYPNEKIGDYYYMDGGSRLSKDCDNIPVRPLVEKEHCDLVFTMPLTKNTSPEFLPGVTVAEIRPKSEMGRILDFNAEHAKKLIEAGYNDTKDTFRKCADLLIPIKQELDLKIRGVIQEQQFLKENAALDASISRSEKLIESLWGNI